MKELILIIGDDIKINRVFLSYLFNTYISKFGSLTDVKFIDRSDKDIFKDIKNLSEEYSYITIFASNENYPLIAKVLASMNDDFLELKFDDTLAPSLSKKVDNKSFLITLNKCEINLVEANPLQKIPNLLIEKSLDEKSFFIYGFDYDESVNMLNLIANKFDIEISFSRYSKFILIVNAKKRKFSDLDGFIKELKIVFLNRVIFDESVAEFIVRKLKEKNLKVSFAESCTAGLVASKIGEVSGASEVFDGSLVTYSNEIKHLWLDVSVNTLNEHGAVSKECVSEMLSGALKMSGADFSMAVSGIAGPTGGSERKPVGTIFIGARDKEKEIVREFHLSGDRNYIREESVNIAFSLLLEIGNFFEGEMDEKDF
ncbi:MAG: CinA family protein [Campylobacteraceae bacterium]|nr:CinA family protein [Campylobacteraceae bacterium]